MELDNIQGYNPFKCDKIYVFDKKKARNVVEFFKNELRFTKGKWKGKSFKPEYWQEVILKTLFGWINKDTGERRYRTVFIYVPRKNGKSELVAGMAVYVFFCDRENDAEIYIGARDRCQATTLFNMCKAMIDQNPALGEECDFYASSKEIKARWDNSLIRAVSADAMSLHSLSPHMAIIDELHAHSNGNLVDALVTGQGARSQPITIYITTADKEGVSICNDELEYAKLVRDGKVKDQTYLPVIFEADPEDDWESEDVWRKVNPTYPKTPSKEYMKTMVKKAKVSLRALNNFKRYNLNMKTSSVEGWLNIDRWNKCKDNTINITKFYNKKVVSAFDLSSTTDITAFGILSEDLDFWCKFYCPQSAIYKDRTGYYKTWVDAGEIVIAGEDVIDYEYIMSDIVKLSESVSIKEIGFDPWNATQVALTLQNKYGFNMVEFRQGFVSMNEPSKLLEALIIEEKIHHNSLVLDWMASNVTVKDDPAGNIKPVKPNKDSPLKIDGIIVMVMCVGLLLLQKLEDDNIYDTRGIITI